MPLTQAPLYCLECHCQQIETHKSYTLKEGTARQLYYCLECKRYFSETQNTPLAYLKTPISRIVLVVQSLREAQVGNAQAWYYHQDKTIVLWKCFFKEGF